MLKQLRTISFPREADSTNDQPCLSRRRTSSLEATNFVKTVETHQHRKIACLEEIAYLNHWITKDQLLTDIEPLKKNQYGQYLMDVMAGKFLDK